MTNKHMWWAWALKEIVNIICWISLAIIFKHWWIALFALFFTSSCASESKPSGKIDDKGEYDTSTAKHGDVKYFDP